MVWALASTGDYFVVLTGYYAAIFGALWDGEGLVGACVAGTSWQCEVLRSMDCVVSHYTSSTTQQGRPLGFSFVLVAACAGRVGQCTAVLGPVEHG